MVCEVDTVLSLLFGLKICTYVLSDGLSNDTTHPFLPFGYHCGIYSWCPKTTGPMVGRLHAWIRRFGVEDGQPLSEGSAEDLTDNEDM